MWNIREAAITDLDQVARLFDEYRQFYKKESDLSGASKFIRERVLKGESRIYVAVDDDEKRFYGFTQLYPSFTSLSMKRIWILNDLFVRPEFRKQGVAKALIERTTTLARSMDAKYVSLSTAIDNKNAQKLYESLGFIRDEEFYHYSLIV
ncbi:GNAT family N-acetyltransferase [Leptospira adleri]|uniref:GNAT family N-acetyltransferase n=1 Tax=Leptospira adleri TaxID=2023186 RepID=A0A2M9YK60_9LEPT|nr:GNAT family N-acetyltransferase [Leptospira adleri]PJZ51927.1 GNAT family N-acetyltransferase [Leptospira adleri]PJZ61651.1 GNAT family N-acetyltransferase [Leptospira adleri]